MKKNIIALFMIVAFFGFIWLITSSTEEEAIHNPFDYARITDVDYKAVLVDEPNEGGKVIVTERLTFDIHAASEDNLFWELWRDLPEEYVDGLKVEYKVNSVKQIYDNGTELVYDESPKLYWDDYDYVSSFYGPGKWYHSEGPYDEDMARYEAVFFYVDGLYREKVVFEIEYEMSNAALRYNDVSELYLAMYSEETIKYLESFKAQILIPDKDMPSKGNYEAFTYGTNAHTFPYEESKTLNPGYHTFSIDLDENDLKFKPYNQYIEFALWGYNEDSHKFTDYAPSNSYSHEDVLEELKNEQQEYEDLPGEGLRNKIIVFVLSVAGSILLIKNAHQKDKKMRKKYNFYEPTMMMQQYFRDIPSNLDPTFARDLVFCKENKPADDGDVYSAILLSLVRKDYIELERIDNTKDWKFANIKIVVKYKPIQPSLTPSDLTTSNQEDGSPIITNTLETNNLNEPTLKDVGESAPLVPTYEYGHMVLKPADEVNTSNEIKTADEITTSNEIKPINTLQVSPAEPIINTVIKEQVNLTEPAERYNVDNKKLEPLTPTEEQYFNLIIRHNKTEDDAIAMSTFQTKISLDYDNTDAFVKAVDNATLNIGISQGYFQKANYKEPQQTLNGNATMLEILGLIIISLGNYIIHFTRIELAWGALFILGVALIYTAVHLRKIAKKYILLTQFGEDEYAKWRGLYNFLNSETLMNERTVIELPIWEQYLVYATAFGISEKVIKAIEIRCPEVEQLTPMLKNPYYRSTNFRVSSRSFSSSVRSASYTSRSGSYGGGYGGGGRGGGGGGGGH